MNTGQIVKEEVFRILYVVVFLIGITVLGGHVFREPILSAWGMRTLMSVPSAVCFVLISTAHIIDATWKLLRLRVEEK